MIALALPPMHGYRLITETTPICELGLFVLYAVLWHFPKKSWPNNNDNDKFRVVCKTRRLVNFDSDSRKFCWVLSYLAKMPSKNVFWHKHFQFFLLETMQPNPPRGGVFCIYTEETSASLNT